MDISSLEAVSQWSKKLNGVLTYTDLEVIFNVRKKVSLNRIIARSVKQGVLIRIKKGVFATREATLEEISTRIYPKSYISTATVLAKNLIIGSVPAKRLQAVKVGPPRSFSSSFGKIEFLSIAPKLYFGFEKINGYNYAIKEKAFLDVCYFYYKRKKFSFNPESDISYELLSTSLVKKFLKKYDKKFISFFKAHWTMYG